MKRILITGAHSYIGTSFEGYIQRYDSFDYQVDTLDLHNPEWVNIDFSIYDCIFHVAGIAHADVGHVSEERKQQYYKVNRDLAVQVAIQAKQSGVKQFIFMSSIIVYGESAPLGKRKLITKDTLPQPCSFYGDSKLQADTALMKMNEENFKVCILRPPMIYGAGCKGNYQTLSKIAKKLSLFPNIENERSMLYIGNLCIFIKRCIDHQYWGIYFPQNAAYVSTTNMVKLIAKTANKRIYVTKMLNLFVYMLSKVPGKIGDVCNKAFGNMTYIKDDSIADFDFAQSVFDSEESKHEIV